MENKYRVFSIRFAEAVLAGAANTTTWDLNNMNRELRIISILFDYRVVTTATFAPLPNEMNQDVLIYMGTQAGIANKVTQIFENVAGTIAFVTGENLWFHKPGHYHFESFFITNTLGMFFEINNIGAVNRTIYGTVIVETEDTTTNT